MTSAPTPTVEHPGHPDPTAPTPTPPAASTVVDAAAVEAAAARLTGVVTTTPLEPNRRLSDLTGTQVWVKREDLQTVRSYKVRGAYNLIAQLGEDERAHGVVCASAGNHAQGVASACAALGVRGRIHLPRTTPRQKRDRIASLGGSFVETIVDGDTYDDAAAAAKAWSVSSGATLVPAFDDPRTIAGQGTVAVEAIAQLLALPDGGLPDVVVVPVGGGGLLAGMLTWLRERHPSVRVVGVEPAGAASLTAALAAGRPVMLEEVDSFVDGAAVRRIGDWTYDVIAGAEVPVVLVPEGRVCVEMLAMYQTDGIITEPAGALAAAALDSLELTPGSRVLTVVSGGNNDVSRYAEVVERALVHEGRKHYFLVDFPQEPGALRRFLDEVLGPDDDITLFEYVKRSNRETGPALVGIEIASAGDLPDLLARMTAAPPTFERIDAGDRLYRFLV